MKYSICVGNIGQVASYATENQALATYAEYVLASKEYQGRAAGESVTLFCDGDIMKEYAPSGFYEIEVTDTFCGEANYCWIKRGTTNARSRRGKIAAAKKLAGWDGWCRVKVADYGDMMEIRPTDSSGVCQIAFVTWRD